jgi:hypothetical protein
MGKINNDKKISTKTQKNSKLLIKNLKFCASFFLVLDLTVDL